MRSCEPFVSRPRGRGNATTSDPPNLHDGRFRGAGALPDDVGDEEQQQSTPDGGGQQLGFGLVDLALDLIRQLAEPGLEVVSSDLGCLVSLQSVFFVLLEASMPMLMGSARRVNR